MGWTILIFAVGAMATGLSSFYDWPIKAKSVPVHSRLAEACRDAYSIFIILILMHFAKAIAAQHGYPDAGMAIGGVLALVLVSTTGRPVGRFFASLAGEGR